MAEGTLRYEHFEILTDEHGLPLRLGRGGMGATLRAYDTRLRRPVALKVINERSLANATIRRRFFNEARAAALIDHPNVARVLYLCPEDVEECFFTMELIEGESLANLVARRGPLSAGEALAILRPVVEALSALADQQLIHRDLKPDNIMITHGGVVKLIDFGIAKPLGEGSERFDLVDSEGQFVGSVYFASPEQILATQPLDQRSDFYSLGATLWNAVAGAPPFTGSRYEVQEGHVHRPLDFGKIAQAPPPLVALLGRLLHKIPAERPSSIAALRAEWDKTQWEVEELALATAETVLETRPSPVIFTSLDVAPDGCAAPTPPARLAIESATGAWLAVREVSYQASAEIRTQLLRAARQVQTALPHSGLLGIREVRDDRVISEWRRGVTAAQLLASRRGGLPIEAVLGWLPAIAEAVDCACAHGFAQTGLEPTQWLISFEALAAGETPLQRAGQAPEHWGLTRVALDPLAGFDAALSSALTNPRDTNIPDRRDPLISSADFLAVLARALHQLLGGRLDRETSPLSALSEARNDLLRAALERRSTATSAAAWTEEFIRVDADDRPRTRATAGSSRLPPYRAAAWRVPTRVLAAIFLILAATIVAGFILRTKPPSAAPAAEVSAPGISPLVATAGSASFTNGLGMEFVPVPINGGAEQVWFCRHETRRREFAAFAGSGATITSERWQSPEVSGVKMPSGAEAEEHPVINVAWEDAVAFCRWLTDHERRAGKLGANEIYRLPADHEWSAAAGTGDREDSHLSPKTKSGGLPDTFPWGRGFPPAAASAGEPLSGNFAGEESRGTWSAVIEGYTDNFITTAPVGSFAANPLGLYDLGGNAWEWCRDEWSGDDEGSNAHVLRGASCINSLPNLLNTSFRRHAGSAALDLCGFRCVIAIQPP